MNNEFPQRRTIRLQGYDYSSEGLYFVSICCQDKVCYFGKIQNEDVILNDAGRMMENEWYSLKERFQHIELHEFIVMPNHFHGIIELTDVENVEIPLVGIQINTGQPQGIAPTIGEIIGAFKSITTNKYIQGVKDYNWMCFNNRLWQRNYYEHIIRNGNSHQNISDYIISNPSNWANDSYYTETNN